jgi:eukaryotic-like serine/threonine-protein kinase
MHDDDPTDTAGATPPDGSISTRPPNAAADHGATSTRATTSASDPTQTDDRGRHSPRLDCDSEQVGEAPLADSRVDTIDHVPAGLADALTSTLVPAGPSPDWAPPTVPGYDGFSPLGEGGMGVVWKARQVKLNRPVALKMVLGDQRAGSKELIRFLAEAEAVAAVKHPHVVQVYEYGDAGGRPFLAMEYLPGGSLTERLKQAGRLDAKAAAELVGTLASAVQAAHDQGIVHRDLKPGNVLYDEQGRPKVTDFGLAKRTGGSDLTATQAVMGTPAYMAPEQARGDTKFVGPQADVYSLGVILYECLTGARPFADPDRFALLRKVVQEEPERPGKRVPGLPYDVELICLKCLAKDPVERYPTTSALAADLARFAAGEPVSVRAAGVVERAAKWARRKPTLAAAYTLGLLAILLGGLGGVAVWQWLAAERLRDKFERFEYGRTMEVAHQEWRENNAAATVALLDSTRPDLRGWEWAYVHRLCHSDLLNLEPHTDIVQSASYSPDGSLILSTSRDKTAKIWDARSGTELLTLKGITNWKGSAAFSPDGSRIVTGSGDNTAKLWDAKTGAEVLTLRGHTADVLSVAYSPDGSRIVTGSQDKTAKTWDARTGAEVLTLRGHVGAVTSASYSPDGSRIVTAAAFDMKVKVWDANTGAAFLTLRGFTDQVGSAVFGPDGSQVVTGGFDGVVRVWNAKTGAEIRTFKGHTSRVDSASFSPDGSLLVSGSFDRTVKVWNAKTGSEVRTFKGFLEMVFSASFSPDGKRIVTVSDHKVRVWDLLIGAEVLSVGRGSAIRSIAYSPDGSRLLVGLAFGSAEVWDATTGNRLLQLKGQTQDVLAVSFSPDGSRLLTSSLDKTAKVWDAETGAEVLTLTGDFREVLFSRDGSLLLAGSRDGTAKAWDIRTGAEVTFLEGQSGPGLSALFSQGALSLSPDGSRVIKQGQRGTAEVWDTRTGSEVFTLRGHTAEVMSASYSPDGSRIVTGSTDNTAKLWDAKSGAEVLTLKAHWSAVMAASFSPDGSRVVTGSYDGTAKVWDSRPVNPEFLPQESAPPQVVK